MIDYVFSTAPTVHTGPIVEDADVADVAAAAIDVECGEAPAKRPARSPARPGIGPGPPPVAQPVRSASGPSPTLEASDACCCPSLPLPLPVPLLRDGPSGTVADRTSPTSVISAIAGVPASHSGLALHYVATQLFRVYETGAQAGWFDVHFHRGPRQTWTTFTDTRGARKTVVTCNQPHAVRRLTTKYLARPETDGWNVLAGAVELARIYALNGSTIFHERQLALDRATRMRLAACLSVAWKFARAAPGRFQRPFTDPEGTGHTLELSVMHAGFLTRKELDCVGAWPTDVDKWQQMQELAMKSEFELLTGMAPFPALCDNPICVAEAALQELYEHGIPGAETHERVLQVRSILPFFLRITLDHEYALYLREAADAGGCETFANALLACAMIACTTAFTPVSGSFAYACQCALATARRAFSCAEYTLAAEIVAVGSALANRPCRPPPPPADDGQCVIELLSPWSGCFNDPSWVLYACVSRPRIRALHQAFLS